MDSIWTMLSCNKQENSKVQLVQTDNAGRGLIAAQDISNGDVIFEEEPYIVGPPQSLGRYFCAHCSQPLNAGLLQDCPQNCGLKFCSNACLTKSPTRHSAEECELAKTIEDTNPNQWLTVLRVLLKRQVDPDKTWPAFLLLQDHLEERKDCPVMAANKVNVWKVLKHYLPSNLTEGITQDVILRICGILDANSFRIDKYGSRGSFLALSMVNHNCLPNARVVFNNEGKVTLVAKRVIKKGQPISITYCSHLLNTPNRLSKLKSSKFFTCLCDLCHDPSEKMTYLSAIVCPKGCKGLMLPHSFHDSNPDWHCNTCKFVTSNEKVQKLLEVISNNYIAIASNPRVLPHEKIQQLESQLKKRQGSVLPSSHQIMLDLKVDLANLYDSYSPNLNTCHRRLEFLRERLAILGKLEGEQADSRLKGFLLFRVHNLLVEKVTHLQRKNSLTETLLQEIGPEIGTSLKESARILMHDQGCPIQLIETMTKLSKGL